MEAINKMKGGMTMQGIAAMAIGALALIVIYTVIPLTGAELDKSISLPATGAGSQWNSSVNANIVTGPSLWQSLGGVIKVGGVIVVIGGFLRTVQGLRS